MALAEELKRAKSGSFDIPVGVHDLGEEGLHIDGARDLHINGNGATLVYRPHGKHRAINVADSQRVHIDNLRVKAPQAFSQGIVRRINAVGFRVQIEDGFPAPSAQGTTKAIFFRKGKLVPFFRHYVERVREVGRQEFEVAFRRPATAGDGPLPAVGDHICMGDREGQHAVTLLRSEDCTLTGIVVYSSGNMAFAERDCSNTLYESCHARPDERCYLSTNGDGFHAISPSVAPSIIGCSVRGCGDDPINVHGQLLLYAAEGIILFRPPNEVKSGLVFAGHNQHELTAGEQLANDKRRDALCKRFEILPKLWPGVVLCKVSIHPKVAVGTYLWNRYVTGGKLADFTATDCYTHHGIKWKSEGYLIERLITRRAGPSSIDDKQQVQWLEGPSGWGTVVDSKLGIP